MSFDGRAYRDFGDRGVSVGFSSVMRRENTRFNESPSYNGMNISVYRHLKNTFYRGEAEFSFEDETAANHNFRGFDRDTRHFNISGSVDKQVFGDWNFNSKISLESGGYRDYDQNYRINENVIDFQTRFTREVWITNLEFFEEIGVIGYEGDWNEFLRLGASTKTTIWDYINIDAGLTANLWDPPGKDPISKVFPYVKTTWIMDSSLSVRFSADPSMRVYTWGDIYDLNGLALPYGGIYENDVRAFSGEIECRILPSLPFTAGLYHRKTRDALVFTKLGDYFDVVKDFTIEVNSLKSTISYDQSNLWGVSGDLIVNSTETNIPYLPNGEIGAEGYFVPYTNWKLMGALRFYGHHYTDIATNQKAGSFLLLNAGAEYTTDYGMTTAIEIRNLTNSHGAWWTDKYKVPGIGLYAGVRAKY
jgi:hypothetical protein